MNTQYKSYYYEGPYYHFGDSIGTFKGITMAVSPEKALSNLTYRCKKEKGFVASAHVTLKPENLRTT